MATAKWMSWPCPLGMPFPVSPSSYVMAPQGKGHGKGHWGHNTHGG